MLKRKFITQILAVVVLELMLGSPFSGISMAVTDAEQSVYGRIGYQYPLGTDNTVEEQLVPDPPQGMFDADLDLSLTAIGVSVSGSLTSTFLEDQITADGHSSASAQWGDQPVFDGDHPDDANDVHGGVGPEFSLFFSEGASSVYVNIAGHLQVSIDGYPSRNPEETFAFVRLLSDEAGVIWGTSLDGTDAQVLKFFDYGLLLESGKSYQLEAIAASGVGADESAPEPHSREASFSLTVTSSYEVLPLPDLIGEFGRLRFHSLLNPGDTIRVPIIVTNMGWADTEKKQLMDIEIYLRPCNATDDSQDILLMKLEDQRVGGLRFGGGSKKFNARLVLPADISETGQYCLFTKIDSSNEVVEMFELNNTALSDCFEIVLE